MRIPFLLLLIAGLAGCSLDPRPLDYGHDRCTHCMMTLTDPRFGAELVTPQGKRLPFDAIECLAAYVAEQQPEVHALWMVDFTTPEVLRPAEEIILYRSPAISSPMGMNLGAFPSAEAARQQAPDGEALGWEEVLLLAGTLSAQTPVRIIAPNDTLATITEAVRRAPAGSEVVVRAGVWHEHRIIIDKPLTLAGEAGAVIDGDGQPILLITADSVSVRGLVFRNVATSFVEDQAAIKLNEASGCVIEDNRFEDTFFGIYLARTSHCAIRGNVLEGQKGSETRSGNGIHMWYSRYIEITGNTVRGHRDGIYLEFVEDSEVADNLSTGNLRYGLHFMFSNRCTYRRNALLANGAGVAVMYSKTVEMTDNRFEDNWGPAAYGLLLKDITDSAIRGNAFRRNTIGIYAEGSNRMALDGNTFEGNGWALKLMANAMDNTVTANNFIANTFDVATNSRQSNSTFAGNYWDNYTGYDLDRDGVGDVPFRPVHLFSLLVEANEPSIILLRSLFIDLLDAAERVLPSLTPETLVDARPALRELQ